MRSSLFAVVVCFLLVAGTIFVQAQTAAPAPSANAPAPRENAMVSFLSPAQQEQYAKARAKALADNPDLKAEGEAIMKQIVANGGQANPAIMEEMDAHREKLRAAMLKEDPTLKPIFTEIDKHISELKAKQLGQLQNSGTNSAPSGQ